MTPANFSGEVRSAVPSLLLSLGRGSAVNTLPPLGSSVYDRQCELLRSFAAKHHQYATSSSSSPASLAAGLRTANTYRGVRERRPGKWVAKIRKPQSQQSVWVGTFDSPETAAHAYDRAAYRLLGEYARLNFPGVMDCPGDNGFPDAVRHIRDVVDAKIQQEIRVDMGRKRTRGVRSLRESKQNQQHCESASTCCTGV